MGAIERLFAARVALLFVLQLSGLAACHGDDWFTMPADLQEAYQAAMRAPAEQVDPWRKLSSLALDHQYVNLALDAAQRVLRVQRDDLEARYIHGLARLRKVANRDDKTSGYREGLSILEPLPENFIGDGKIDAIRRGAAAAIAAEESIKQSFEQPSPQAFHDAARHLEDAIRSDPENLVYRESLVWVYAEKLLDPARAYPHARLVAERLPGGDNPLGKIDACVAWAWVASALGRDDEAIEALEKFSAFGAVNEDHKLRLADKLLADGRFARGIELYQQLSNSHSAGEKSRAVIAKYLGPTPLPAETQARFIVAIDGALAQLRAADYLSAASQLARAVQIHPQSHFAQVTLGWVYLEKVGDPRRALEPLRAATALRPDDASAWGLLGTALYQAGDFSQAIDAFQEVLVLTPDDLGIRVSLGMALARCQQFDLAWNAYCWVLESAEISSTPRARALLGIAELRAWQGETQSPLNMAWQLLDEDPEFIEARLLLGDLERWSWNLSRAQNAYLSVLDTDPANQAAYQGLDEISRLQAWTPAYDYYNFTDNFEFARVDSKFSLRLLLGERTYVTGSWDEWSFSQHSIETSRTETRVAVEHHLTRTVTLSGSCWAFEYPHTRSQEAWSLGGRVSPVGLASVSLAYANNEPAYLDSINVPLKNIRMNSLGGGIDIPLGEVNSIQCEYIDSLYSDDNRRRFASGQFSRRLLPDNNNYHLRLKYEFLTYEDQVDDYFSPAEFQLVRPILDVAHPLCDWLWLSLRLETPYVQQTTGGFGYTFQIGPDIRLGDAFSLRAHYMTTSLPTDAPFSGNVVVVHAAANF